MTIISAEIILDSQFQQHRLTTFLLRYPRWIHAEFMTHRVFSRNAASSRAIPVEKLIRAILDDPAVPMFWGKDQKGMQAGEEHNAPVELNRAETYCSGVAEDGTETESYFAKSSREEAWEWAMTDAIDTARAFAQAGYHKQIVNRLLEPFSHITVLASATELSNFFELRLHKDAEPHFQLLAAKMYSALSESIPQDLRLGEWHIPFGNTKHFDKSEIIRSVACCASTSYKTVEGFDMTMERAQDIFAKLVTSLPEHASPLEHVAVVASQGICIPSNYKGFNQLRHIHRGLL